VPIVEIVSEPTLDGEVETATKFFREWSFVKSIIFIFLRLWSYIIKDFGFWLVFRAGERYGCWHFATKRF